ncbi:MAG: helix-turn-helix domain-containing protein [Opitutaceae bacterium]|nr:helix-turn-helix domain-containing protein [Opitutaceae bacterium]
MDEKMRFVSLVQTDRFTISSLCEQFGISRKTAHKWLGRYQEGGMEALGERSHRPRRFPAMTGSGRISYTPLKP